MKFCLKYSVLLVVLVSSVFGANILRAQESKAVSTNSLSITDLAVKDSQWVFFANTPEITFAYDKNSIERLDSMHLRIWIKKTPKEVFYLQVKSEEMMEHRSLQSYENRSHVEFDYEGYERYGFTIVHEEIDGSKEKYKILKTIDYDINGEVLSKTEPDPESPQWITGIGVAAQTTIIDLLFKPKQTAALVISNK